MADVAGTKVDIAEDLWDYIDTPGAFQFTESYRGMWFVCPSGCGEMGYLTLGPSQQQLPRWQWNGDEDAPTLVPGVTHKGVGAATHWRGYLRNGVWQDAAGTP